MKKRIFAAAGGILAVSLLIQQLLVHHLFLFAIPWQTKEIILPQNPGLYEGSLTLENGQVRYLRDGEVIWQMMEEYRVMDMDMVDIDHDGWCEAVMLVWTRGDFGRYHPLWEKPNQWFYTQRFYILNLEEDRLFPQWMSSKLPFEVSAMEVKEDGTILLKAEDETETSWQWQGRGMVLMGKK